VIQGKTTLSKMPRNCASAAYRVVKAVSSVPSGGSRILAESHRVGRSS
jgi:hypothetical protein